MSWQIAKLEKKQQPGVIRVQLLEMKGHCQQRLTCSTKWHATERGADCTMKDGVSIKPKLVNECDEAEER